MFESAALIGRKSKVLLWHVPGHSSGYIPDSRELWEFLWKHRRELVGIAHTHPGGGMPGPSWEDVTTFSAIERALGRRLNWWIVNSDETVVCRWLGPEAHDYGAATLDLILPWVEELRRNSGIMGRSDVDWVMVEGSTTACKHGKTDCARCGTTSRRDRVHRTIDGKGVVGRIK